ncbi:MAG: outer membrane protein assembly factor BamD [Planctomycetota bacterium]
MKDLRFFVGILSVCILGASFATGADQPRTRKLDYDPVRKTWVELPPPPPGTAAGDLHLIRMGVEEKEFRQALKSVKGFVNRYGEEDSLYPEVLVAKAGALVGNREYDKAYKVLQAFLNEFSGMSITEEALRLEFVIAEAYLSGVKRRFLGIPMLSGVDEAYKILDEISVDYPESPLAELAVKLKADHLFTTGEHALSELDYARLLRDFPQSRYQSFGMRRSADAALASFGGVDYDEAAVIEAEERYKDYQARFPQSAGQEGVDLILENIRVRRAEKEFAIGAYYERTDHLSSAAFYYRQTRDQWQGTIAADRATARLKLLGIGDEDASSSDPSGTGSNE